MLQIILVIIGKHRFRIVEKVIIANARPHNDQAFIAVDVCEQLQHIQIKLWMKQYVYAIQHKLLFSVVRNNRLNGIQHHG